MMHAPPTHSGALAGITVLDLSRLLPGPYCSMILADHGARVIAVEDRRFAAEGLFIRQVNRNKQHISLNLKTAEGLEVFRRLARRADVLIEGFRPGVVQRLGVDYASLSRDNPRLVYCSITGYGQEGALRERAGHDVNYLAQAGVLDLIGLPEHPPSIPGVQLADIAGGALMAVIGIQLALLARERTHQGQYIDISMTDGAAALLPLVLFLREQAGATPRRGDAMFSHRFACYNTYRTADGRHVAIGALENRFWQALCSHLGRPEYGPLQYDEPRREELLGWLRAVFIARPLAEWEAELGPLEVCFAPVRNVDEVLADPELRRRGMVVDEPRGPNLGIPVRLGATPGRVRTPPPAFGADTEAVLAELGYDARMVAELRRQGAI
jgi:crotonobetainyl-CoA:carnitine CoA-transferase CaiB-like acyl-CoA transferase